MSDNSQSEKKRKNKMLRTGAYALSGIFLLMGCYFGYRLYSSNKAYEDARRDWSEVQDIAHMDPEPTTASGEPATVQDYHIVDTNDSIPDTRPELKSDETVSDIDKTDTNMMHRIDFGALQSMSGDVTSWLVIPNTSVDYPVMQETQYPSERDEPYYLHRNMYGTYSVAGSLFMPDLYISDVDNSIAHKIIYGHNMKDGSMFASLLNYKSKDFYENNKYFYIYYPDRTERWLICSAMHLQSGCRLYNTPYIRGTEEYKLMLDEIKEMSYYDTGVVKFNNYVPSITLSTCDWTRTDLNGRMAITGALDATLYWD